MITPKKVSLILGNSLDWGGSRLGVLMQGSSGAAELRHLPLEEIRSRCPEEVEDSRMYVPFAAMLVCRLCCSKLCELRLLVWACGLPSAQVPFANIGLPLQPRFRTVRSIKRSQDMHVQPHGPGISTAGFSLEGIESFPLQDEIIAWVAAQEDGTNAGFIFGVLVAFMVMKQNDRSGPACSCSMWSRGTDCQKGVHYFYKWLRPCSHRWQLPGAPTRMQTDAGA